MDNKKCRIITEDKRKRGFYDQYLTFTTELNDNLVLKEIYLNPEAEIKIENKQNCLVYAITGDIYINGKFCDESSSCVQTDNELFIRNLYNFSVIHFIIIEFSNDLDLLNTYNNTTIDTKNELKCILENESFSISLGEFNYKKDYSIEESMPSKMACVYVLNGAFEKEGIKIEAGEHLLYCDCEALNLEALTASSVMCLIEFKTTQGCDLEFA